ncbi:hypothetical protein HCN44_009791 [Aphidius gifuensis]|uniref:Uncharacterized protein n=1 Tax=Aphidius gifuensis TaxID=684658 RepID=A0A834Y760_APHGI|nr:hypothetical protein HCN44_009791 [Aphidius gifuensis]
MTDKDTEQFENGSVPSENTLTDSYQSLTDSDFDMSGVTSSIYYADTSNDIQVSLARARSSVVKLKKSFQPRPVIVGPIENIQASYIAIDKELLPADNPLHAVEVMLKIYYILNLEFPPEAALSWKFLALAIYNFAPKGKIPGGIKSLINEVNDMRKKIEQRLIT